MKKLEWMPMKQDQISWMYSSDPEDEAERKCIGHLRGDFGSGKEFWTSWFDRPTNLKTDAFCKELQDVVNGLRKALLKDLPTMSKQCRNGLSYDNRFGFCAESAKYAYFLRCIPLRGCYNFYLYCYEK